MKFGQGMVFLEVSWVERYERRNLLLVITGRFESMLGVAALGAALPLHVLDLTRSGAVMGLVSLLGLLPRLVVLPFGGVIGDKVNRKWWMVAMDELHGLLLLTLWRLSKGGKLSLPVLLVFVALSAVVDGLFSSPTAAMFGDVVRKERMKLATSLNAMSRSLALILGPVIGGLLYGAFGFENVLLTTGLLYLFSGFTEAFIVYKVGPKEGNTRFLHDLSEATRFVWSNGGLRYLFVFAVVLNFLVSPLFSIVLPYLSRVVFRFSSAQFGMLQTFTTAGALLGNVSIVLFLRHVSSKNLVNWGLLSQSLFSVFLSLALMVLSQLRSQVVFSTLAVGVTVIGFFNVLVNVPLNATLQVLVPSGMRSRVFSVLEFIATCMVPASSLLYGSLLDRLPPLPFFLFVNVVSLGVVVIFVSKSPPGIFEEPVAER